MSDSADDELVILARARIGQVLCGKYRLERVLGIGGMASVYGAVHRNGRHVAIKVLHPELSTNAAIRERFVREGLAANAAKHPGVVEVIDDDVAEDGSAFLVMELLAGRSVEEIWETSGLLLQTRSVLAIASELCAVLAAAHSAGIVHRDIKPANLFVTDDGRLKVLDFGIARLRDVAPPKRTSTGMVLGTPSFMAPEQANGRASQIDERTDVWAVGATMFVLLSGRAVHEGETAQHVAILAATQAARSLAIVAPHVPSAVTAVVDRALARDKHARWGTSAEMWTAIEHARQQLHLPGEASNVTLRALVASSKGQTVRIAGSRPNVQASMAFAPTGIRVVAGRGPASSMAATALDSMPPAAMSTPPAASRGALRLALPLMLGIAVFATWFGARHRSASKTNATSAPVAVVASISAPPAISASAGPSVTPVPPAPAPVATTTASARPRRGRVTRPTPVAPVPESVPSVRVAPRAPGPLDTQD